MDRWAKLDVSADEREQIVGKNRSFAQDVFFRFMRKKSAVAGMILIVLIFLFSFIGPLLTPYSFETQQLPFANIPPILPVIEIEGRLIYQTPNMKMIEVDTEGHLLAPLASGGEDMMNKRVRFKLDAAGEQILELDYKSKPARLLYQDEVISSTRKIWNRSFLLGTDALGRDLLTRLMFGSRISMIVALVATFVNMTIGIIYGGTAGYAGGTLDTIMMRIVDLISTIPLTLYVILIMVVLSSGFMSIIVALSSVYWVSMARVVRGQIRQLRENEFILAAQTIGSSTSTILFRHLIPNVMGPILVTATMQIPSAIFIEAFLSFIGLGIAPPMASLGTMCNDSVQALRSAPYQLFFPSLMICLIMFAFNFVGDGLRDALDPKLKK